MNSTLHEVSDDSAATVTLVAAGRFVSDAPEPLNVVAVTIPVISAPVLLNVSPMPVTVNLV